MRTDDAFAFAWHHHAEYEITLIVNGRGTRFVGDHLSGYEPGDLVLHGPHLPHTYESLRTVKGPHEAVVVQFSDDIFGKRGLDALGPGPLHELLKNSQRGIHFVQMQSQGLAARLLAMPTLAPVAQLAELLLLLEAMAQATGVQTLSTRVFSGREGTSRQHPLDKVHRYVSEHLANPITVQDAAGQAGMGASTFSRFIKRSTGHSFVRYLTEMRIAEACRLLIDTDAAISQIAREVGLANVSHFNDRFLSLRNIRPSEYRRAFRKR
ncbi:MAG: AraC family transcriptional regulator [Deltaproteobacteria bacterium]|nr:AraC family transcriptional regulator [Deltaproteobacteria bacterium]